MDKNAVDHLVPGVYRLTWPNGYFYIGQAANLRNRWRSHRYGFKTGHMESHQIKLYNVWAKYGVPAFEVLEYCPTDKLNDVEQRHISAHWGDPLLCNTSPSSRNSRGAKRSKPPWNKGIPMTPEHNQLLQDARGDQSGEKHPMCKLTDKQVMEIRSKYIPFKCTAEMLSREYNITKESVLQIVNSKSWTHLPAADIKKNQALIARQGLIEFKGESRNLHQWAEHLGLDYLTLYQRVKKYNWPIERAFGIPSTDKGQKLTEDQVRTIRQRYAHQKKGFGSTALGKEYGVSHKTILGVVTGQRYTNVV